jgi:hypothetical protein
MACHKGHNVFFESAMPDEYFTGLGTTVGMWTMLSELLDGEKLPTSLDEAIHKLCKGEAALVPVGIIQTLASSTKEAA